MPDFEAGYDFVPLTIGLRQTLRGETSGIMGTKQVETSVLEAFYISLAAGEDLARTLIDRVGTLQKQVVERLVQFDCVGAIRMPDDLGYTTGMPR